MLRQTILQKDFAIAVSLILIANQLAIGLTYDIVDGHTTLT